MQPAKRSDCERIAKHAAKCAVPLVLQGTQSVAVLDVRAPSADVLLDGTELVIDAHVLAKNLTTPAVVIARDHRNRDAGIHDVRQRSDGSKAVAWHHRFPFEPELEQIAVDDQRSARRRNVPEERDHRPLDVRFREAEMRIRHDVAGCLEHARSLRSSRSLYKRAPSNDLRQVTKTSSAPTFHDVEFRVRYAETDQMGVVYHTNYLIWCEVGRTDFIRARGMSYADIERAGIGLAVSELSARFHGAARYDDLIRVRTTLADVRSRSITFDYVITRVETGDKLVTARTALVSIDPQGRLVALPPAVRALFDVA